MRKKLTLRLWLKSIGDARASSLLNVDRTTVRHWRLGYGLPKALHMLKIKRATRGALSCDAMIEHHFETVGE
jgi:DNA-binding transcriptional regulator YdaS (Cro superfamily)